jgi:hypothetical protein
MKTVILLMLLLGVAAAQQTPSVPQEQANSGVRIQPGTVIPAELDKSLDAKKVKPGDPVVAKVSQDLLSNGQVVIPVGSKITGRVTQAQAHKSDSASELGIVFEQITMKNGNQVPFHADIQALAPPPQNPALAGTGGNDPMSESGPGGTPGAGGMGQRGGVASTPTAPTGGANPYPQPSGAPATSAGVGQLSSGSQGAVNMKDVTLHAGANPSEGSIISSDRKNVHLDSGTQLMLRVTQ